MKKNNFYVIGGQYEYYCYGGTPTLLGAKRLANKSMEYWDNLQGWHRPKIYTAADVQRAHNFYGEQIVPASNAKPVEW